MGLADLHLHTIYSYDGTSPVPAVLARAKQLELDVIAITDHDEIRGALKAADLAPSYGIEVIPGIEITTAEGDLLALSITKKISPGLGLVDTILRVRDLGGLCIAPHPMAGGMGMKSLSARSIFKALRDPRIPETLVGLEVYNATAIDRISNHRAALLGSRLNIACTGSSDAHIIDTIGFGVTEFKGRTADDLLAALKNRTTHACRRHEWNAVRVLGSWGLRYLESAFTRLGFVSQV